MEYLSFDKEMKRRFGGKVYRLSLSSGCSCPNRDGTCGSGGCIFCSEGGSGEFAAGFRNVNAQIEEAKGHVAAKLSKNFAGYIAYFQSYSNTYGDPARLEALFLDAAAHEGILGLSIATRPDCLPPEIMEMLERVRQVCPVWVELGLQTADDRTAELINRGYPTAVYEEAVRKLHAAGIEVVTHMIAGLPGEGDEDALRTASLIADAGSDGIKIQLLQVLKGTELQRILAREALFSQDSQEEMPARRSISLKQYTLESYTDLLIRILKLLPPEMVIHRLTGDPPKRLLISPEWTADKKKVMNYIRRRIAEA